jgi:poly(3-hydroxybutyrate) depolymerase
MRQILAVLGLASIALVAACGSSSGPTTTPPPAAGAGASSTSAGATGSSAGATGSSAGATGSSAGATGSSAGATGDAGGAGNSGGASNAGAAGAGTAGAGTAGSAGASTSNYGGIVGLEDLTTVKPSAGCGTDIKTAYPAIAQNAWQPKDNHDYKSGFTIDVPTPANHPVPAIAGKTLTRRYFIKLPTGYDSTKPYKLIYEGAGCTGYGTDVPDYFTVSKGNLILVALEIYPGVWGGGSTGPGSSVTGDPGISCFDDKRGDLSIDKPFFEMIHAKLMTQLCVDQHRIFISGHSSGGWLTEQFGNSYGSKIIRAIAPSSGGLAQGVEQQATDGLPVPGIWWHQTNDGTNPFSGTQDAITHALSVNKCTNTDFATSPQVAQPYPNVTICQKFTSCPKEFPIILCREAGSNHANAFDDPNQRAAAWSFLDAF